MHFLRSLYQLTAKGQRNLRILALAMYLVGTFAHGITLLLHETSHRVAAMVERGNGHRHSHSHSHAHSGSGSSHHHAGWMMIVLASEDETEPGEAPFTQTEVLSVHLLADESPAIKEAYRQSPTPFTRMQDRGLVFPPDCPPPWQRSTDMLMLSGEGRG